MMELSGIISLILLVFAPLQTEALWGNNRRTHLWKNIPLGGRFANSGPSGPSNTGRSSNAGQSGTANAGNAGSGQHNSHFMFGRPGTQKRFLFDPPPSTTPAPPPPAAVKPTTPPVIPAQSKEFLRKQFPFARPNRRFSQSSFPFHIFEKKVSTTGTNGNSAGTNGNLGNQPSHNKKPMQGSNQQSKKPLQAQPSSPNYPYGGTGQSPRHVAPSPINQAGKSNGIRNGPNTNHGNGYRQTNQQGPAQITSQTLPHQQGSGMQQSHQTNAVNARNQHKPVQQPQVNQKTGQFSSPKQPPQQQIYQPNPTKVRNQHKPVQQPQVNQKTGQFSSPNQPPQQQIYQPNPTNVMNPHKPAQQPHVNQQTGQFSSPNQPSQQQMYQPNAVNARNQHKPVQQPQVNQQTGQFSSPNQPSQQQSYQPNPTNVINQHTPARQAQVNQPTGQFSFPNQPAQQHPQKAWSATAAQTPTQQSTGQTYSNIQPTGRQMSSAQGNPTNNHQSWSANGVPQNAPPGSKASNTGVQSQQFSSQQSSKQYSSRNLIRSKTSQHGWPPQNQAYTQHGSSQIPSGYGPSQQGNQQATTQFQGKQVAQAVEKQNQWGSFNQPQTGHLEPPPPTSNQNKQLVSQQQNTLYGIPPNNQATVPGALKRHNSNRQTNIQQSHTGTFSNEIQQPKPSQSHSGTFPSKIQQPKPSQSSTHNSYQQQAQKMASTKWGNPNRIHSSGNPHGPAQLHSQGPAMYQSKQQNQQIPKTSFYKQPPQQRNPQRTVQVGGNSWSSLNQKFKSQNSAGQSNSKITGSTKTRGPEQKLPNQPAASVYTNPGGTTYMNNKQSTLQQSKSGAPNVGVSGNQVGVGKWEFPKNSGFRKFQPSSLNTATGNNQAPKEQVPPTASNTGHQTNEKYALGQWTTSVTGNSASQGPRQTWEPVVGASLRKGQSANARQQNNWNPVKLNPSKQQAAQAQPPQDLRGKPFQPKDVQQSGKPYQQRNSQIPTDKQHTQFKPLPPNGNFVASSKQNIQSNSPEQGNTQNAQGTPSIPFTQKYRHQDLNTPGQQQRQQQHLPQWQGLHQKPNTPGTVVPHNSPKSTSTGDPQRKYMQNPSKNTVYSQNVGQNPQWYNSGASNIPSTKYSQNRAPPRSDPYNSHQFPPNELPVGDARRKPFQNSMELSSSNKGSLPSKSGNTFSLSSPSVIKTQDIVPNSPYPTGDKIPRQSNANNQNTLKHMPTASHLQNSLREYRQRNVEHINPGSINSPIIDPSVDPTQNAAPWASSQSKINSEIPSHQIQSSKNPSNGVLSYNRQNNVGQGPINAHKNSGTNPTDMYSPYTTQQKNQPYPPGPQDAVNLVQPSQNTLITNNQNSANWQQSRTKPNTNQDITVLSTVKQTANPGTFNEQTPEQLPFHYSDRQVNQLNQTEWLPNGRITGTPEPTIPDIPQTGNAEIVSGYRDQNQITKNSGLRRPEDQLPVRWFIPGEPDKQTPPPLVATRLGGQPAGSGSNYKLQSTHKQILPYEQRENMAGAKNQPNPEYTKSSNFNSHELRNQQAPVQWIAPMDTKQQSQGQGVQKKQNLMNMFSQSGADVLSPQGQSAAHSAMKQRSNSMQLTGRPANQNSNYVYDQHSFSPDKTSHQENIYNAQDPSQTTKHTSLSSEPNIQRPSFQDPLVRQQQNHVQQQSQKQPQQKPPLYHTQGQQHRQNQGPVQWLSHNTVEQPPKNNGPLHSTGVKREPSQNQANQQSSFQWLSRTPAPNSLSQYGLQRSLFDPVHQSQQSPGNSKNPSVNAEQQPDQAAWKATEPTKDISSHQIFADKANTPTKKQSSARDPYTNAVASDVTSLGSEVPQNTWNVATPKTNNIIKNKYSKSENVPIKDKSKQDKYTRYRASPDPTWQSGVVQTPLLPRSYTPHKSESTSTNSNYRRSKTLSRLKTFQKPLHKVTSTRLDKHKISKRPVSQKQKPGKTNQSPVERLKSMQSSLYSELTRQNRKVQNKSISNSQHIRPVNKPIQIKVSHNRKPTQTKVSLRNPHVRKSVKLSKSKAPKSEVPVLKHFDKRNKFSVVHGMESTPIFHASKSRKVPLAYPTVRRKIAKLSKQKARYRLYQSMDQLHEKQNHQNNKNMQSYKNPTSAATASSLPISLSERHNIPLSPYEMAKHRSSLSMLKQSGKSKSDLTYRSRQGDRYLSNRHLSKEATPVRPAQSQAFRHMSAIKTQKRPEISNQHRGYFHSSFPEKEIPGGMYNGKVLDQVSMQKSLSSTLQKPGQYLKNNVAVVSDTGITQSLSLGQIFSTPQPKSKSQQRGVSRLGPGSLMISPPQISLMTVNPIKRTRINRYNLPLHIRKNTNNLPLQELKRNMMDRQKITGPLKKTRTFFYDKQKFSPESIIQTLRSAASKYNLLDKYTELPSVSTENKPIKPGYKLMRLLKETPKKSNSPVPSLNNGPAYSLKLNHVSPPERNVANPFPNSLSRTVNTHKYHGLLSSRKQNIMNLHHPVHANQNNPENMIKGTVQVPKSFSLRNMPSRRTTLRNKSDTRAQTIKMIKRRTGPKMAMRHTEPKYKNILRGLFSKPFPKATKPFLGYPNIKATTHEKILNEVLEIPNEQKNRNFMPMVQHRRPQSKDATKQILPFSLNRLINKGKQTSNMDRNKKPTPRTMFPPSMKNRVEHSLGIPYVQRNISQSAKTARSTEPSRQNAEKKQLKDIGFKSRSSLSSILTKLRNRKFHPFVKPLTIV